ncbi:hypothetical protein [Peterkaempfera sp. SMS 1(5)a]|uniref:hypothetical protein n=1 Tax=Peterkaempfera podocarpi TaxID=3232308 RepID=UPI0036703D8F
MDLRSELLPPPVPQDRLGETCQEIECIAALIALGKSEVADGAIAAFNETTSHSYKPHDFAHYQSWRDLKDFAKEAARPARPHMASITHDELTEIVQRILAGAPESDY